jgi:hypothetical protein
MPYSLEDDMVHDAHEVQEDVNEILGEYEGEGLNPYDEFPVFDPSQAESPHGVQEEVNGFLGAYEGEGLNPYDEFPVSDPSQAESPPGDWGTWWDAYEAVGSEAETENVADNDYSVEWTDTEDSYVVPEYPIDGTDGIGGSDDEEADTRVKKLFDCAVAAGQLVGAGSLEPVIDSMDSPDTPARCYGVDLGRLWGSVTGGGETDPSD